NIYPQSGKNSPPVKISNMKLAQNVKTVLPEARVKGWKKGFLGTMAQACSVFLQAQLGRYLIKAGKKAGSFDGKKYLDDFLRNTDHRKFDGALRMVIDSSEEQKGALTRFLEKE